MEYHIRYIPKSNDYIFDTWIDADTKEDAIRKLKKNSENTSNNKC